MRPRLTIENDQAVIASLRGARRLIRAVRILARDGRSPRPLRALVASGVLPIPGPFDEAALLAAGGALWLFHRESLQDAWREAAVV